MDDFEKDLTEWEKAVNWLSGYRYYYKPALKKDAAELLEVAKRELQKSESI